MLRNPNLTIFSEAFPNNAYKVTVRTLKDKSAEVTEVELNLCCYPSGDLDSVVYSQHRFKIQLGNNPSYSEYEDKILEEFPERIVDGSRLSDFTKI